MSVTLAAIRPLLTIADICDLLRISERQFYALKEEGFFARHGLLVPFHPEIDRRPRYLGEPFARLLDSKGQTRELRAALQQVKP